MGYGRKGPEQIENLFWPPKSRKGKYRKFMKKQLHKWMRLSGKRLLDDAPKKRRYCGWEW